MKIHEFQAKQLFRDHGIPVPRGVPAASTEEVRRVASELGAQAFVVKAQIHAGGRAMGRFEGALLGDGGVRSAATVDAAVREAGEMLGHVLHTAQTGPGGQIVRHVYIEEKSKVKREMYLAILVDRGSGRVTLVASGEGGVGIEEVAERSPGSIEKRVVDPAEGLSERDAGELAAALDLEGRQADQAVKIMLAAYALFVELDATLLEINPLAVTADGDLLALDAALNLDDNALFRHEDIRALRDDDEFSLGELKAAQHGVNYVKLDGSIGCLASGAGFALATLDAIKLSGGEPANFLDVPPDSKVDRVRDAFELVLSDPGLKCMLVNVFGGGIMRCDAVADAILISTREKPLQVPLVVRLAGTNSELALRRLKDSGPPMIFAGDLAEAAEKAVSASHESKIHERRHWWQRTVGNYPRA